MSQNIGSVMSTRELKRIILEIRIIQLESEIEITLFKNFHSVTNNLGQYLMVTYDPFLQKLK